MMLKELSQKLPFLQIGGKHAKPQSKREHQDIPQNPAPAAPVQMEEHTS